MSYDRLLTILSSKNKVSIGRTARDLQGRVLDRLFERR